MTKTTRKERGIIAAALLAVIILATSTSGCVSPTPSPSPTPHDSLLEGLVSADYNQTARNATIILWNVTWNNGTTVNIQFALQNLTQSAFVTGNRTFIRFGSADAAASFMDSTNLTGYTLSGGVPTSAPTLANFSLIQLYQNVTGHSPTTYRTYIRTVEGQNTLAVLAIAQADDVVSLTNVTALRCASVSPTASPLPSASPTPTPTPTPTASATPTPSSSVTNTTTAVAQLLS
ncbi:MAG: hypothetical protein ACXV5K_11345 [Halobacteriota archaeon]